jgi:hypothetical protein
MAKKEIIRDFASWGEYRTELGKLDPERRQGDRYWCGTDSIGEALQIADIGWPDGMARVQAITMPVVNTIASTLATDGGWTYDVTGAAYDVGEYLSGVPECWLTPDAVASRPCVTIGANIVSSGGIPKEMLELRGAAVCALAMSLQTAGYAVRVFAIEGMRTENGDVWHRVCLTDDNGGPLDTDRMLFALAHPSAARQLGYSLGNNMQGCPYSSWLGWPRGDMRATPPEAWATDLYLAPPYLSDADWSTPESVSRWVADTYAKLTNADATAAKG